MLSKKRPSQGTREAEAESTGEWRQSTPRREDARFQSFPSRDWDMEQSTLYDGTQQIAQLNERHWLQKLASTADLRIVNRHSFQKKQLEKDF
ncbi:unnamed protein product [Caretta caretta]